MDSLQRQIDYVLWHNATAMRSAIAGFSFGRLFYQYMPDASLAKIIVTASTLRLSNRQDRRAYQLAFVLAWLRAKKGVNMLTLDEQERQILMASISKAQNKTLEERPVTPFHTMDEIFAVIGNDENCCIKSIRSGEGKFGPQWYIKMQVPLSVAKALETDAEDCVMVSLSKGKIEPTTRDMDFENIIEQNDWPAHCAKWQPRVLRTGHTYAVLTEDTSGVCVCGEIIETEPVSHDSDDPFLPDYPDDVNDGVEEVPMKSKTGKK